MGVASSRQNYESRLQRRSSPKPKHRKRTGRIPTGKKKRRGFLRKIRAVPTTQPTIPINRHSPRRHAHGFQPVLPLLSPYVPPLRSPVIYPNYLPMSYNNYAAPYYMPPRQPLMISPQQYPPMSIPRSQPMFMPQPMVVPSPSPMIIPQQVSPPIYSPYMSSSPYAMNLPYSMPYGQQSPQAQMQPIYNNIGISTPIPAGMVGQRTPYLFPYQATMVKLSTDWTGGGKISPGFLGPPI